MISDQDHQIFWDQVGDPAGRDRDQRIQQALQDVPLGNMMRDFHKYSDTQRLRQVEHIADCLAEALERVGLSRDPEAGALVWEHFTGDATRG